MSKKRANGEGSVYKTKDGRVIGSWQDANGKTRYKTSKTMTKVAPKAVQEATEEYRSNMDRLGQFLEEACDTGPSYQVPLGELYQRYSNWVTADGNTEKAEGKITFGQRLESKGYVKGKTKDKNPVRVWEGLRLKPGY